MAAASYPSGLFDQPAFNVGQLSNIPDDPNAPAGLLTNPHFVSGDSRPPVIHQLFGALIDVLPNAWLFV
jgi:hypothetical protein